VPPSAFAFSCGGRKTTRYSGRNTDALQTGARNPESYFHHCFSSTTGLTNHIPNCNGTPQDTAPTGVSVCDPGLSVPRITGSAWRSSRCRQRSRATLPIHISANHRRSCPPRGGSSHTRTILNGFSLSLRFRSLTPTSDGAITHAPARDEISNTLVHYPLFRLC
jgi:hypothetical protein